MYIAMGAMMAAMAVGAIVNHRSGHHQTASNQTTTQSCCAVHAASYSGGNEQSGALLASADQMNAKAASSDAHSEAKLPYPIDYCIVSGEKLDEMGEPVTKVYEGREVKFCCNMCPEKFENDQATFMKKLDDAIIAKQKPGYPLETCIVSGEAFGGEMGDPVDFIYDNQYFKLCCKGCIKDIKKDPAKYMQKLETAYKSGASSTEDNAKAAEHKDGHEGHH
jgi:YHS domain-containing protein